jgi:hypothetical protein
MFRHRTILLLCLLPLACDIRAPSHPRATTANPDGRDKPAEAITITADGLFNAFVESETGDQQFTGKLLRVDGTVRTVRPIEGKPCVELYVTADRNAHTIRCLFEPSDEAEVNTLVSGRTVVIRGTCAGVRDNHVTLENCFIAVR